MEQSSPPWRVFDAPSASPASGAAREAAREGEAGLTVQPVALLGIAGAILLGAIAIGVAIAGVGGEAAGPAVSDHTGLAVASAVPGRAGSGIVVDVAGAVVQPGVYHLAAGARVADAIDAAGGFSPRVDAGRAAAAINLAATLTDGQQVRVPSRDDESPVGDSGAGGSGGGSGSLVDLNAATQAELEGLPGIGPVTAGKIIESRTETPFRSIEELRERGLVGQKTFDSIRALITAS